MESVLITGSSRGLGLAFVSQLCRAVPTPKFIFASCRGPDTAKELQALAADHDNVIILQLDVQDEATYAPAVEKITSLVGSKGLTVLINNAAIKIPNDYETVSRATLTKVLDINLISPIRLTQTFLPLIRQSARSSAIADYSVKRGAVINIASGFASIGEYTEDGTRMAGYRESKVALHMFTKALSLDTTADKVLVLAINPGWIRTDMGLDVATEEAFPTKTSDQAAGEILEIMDKASEEQNGLALANELPFRTLPC